LRWIPKNIIILSLGPRGETGKRVLITVVRKHFLFQTSEKEGRRNSQQECAQEREEKRGESLGLEKPCR